MQNLTKEDKQEIDRLLYMVKNLCSKTSARLQNIVNDNIHNILLATYIYACDIDPNKVILKSEVQKSNEYINIDSDNDINQKKSTLNLDLNENNILIDIKGQNIDINSDNSTLKSDIKKDDKFINIQSNNKHKKEHQLYRKDRENECRQILEEYFDGYKFITVRPNFLKYPLTNRNLEIDCYNEDLNIALEYNGLQHYEYKNIYHKTYEDFLSRQNRDNFKYKKLHSMGINLIIVKYDVKDLISYIQSKLKELGYIKKYTNDDINSDPNNTIDDISENDTTIILKKINIQKGKYKSPHSPDNYKKFIEDAKSGKFNWYKLGETIKKQRITDIFYDIYGNGIRYSIGFKSCVMKYLTLYGFIEPSDKNKDYIVFK